MLSRIRAWCVARLRVARFLANLWQTPLPVVVKAASAYHARGERRRGQVAGGQEPEPPALLTAAVSSGVDGPPASGASTIGTARRSRSRPGRNDTTTAHRFSGQFRLSRSLVSISGQRRSQRLKRSLSVAMKTWCWRMGAPLRYVRS